MEKKVIKEIESKKINYAPMYFDQYLDENQKRIYKFNGKYWKDREKVNWSNIPSLFSI